MDGSGATVVWGFNLVLTTHCEARERGMTSPAPTLSIFEESTLDALPGPRTARMQGTPNGTRLLGCSPG